MKSLRLLLVLVTVLGSLSSFAGEFPRGPHPQATPGDTCDKGNTRRYPERVLYCERNVSSGTKRQVIEHYERQLGFSIYEYGRQEFKIDHFIPLCAGGSNEFENLWPQHKSVYAITDPLEEPLCKKMAEGRLSQERAIELIMEAKLNLNRAPAILRTIQAL